jgi:hypothetical protein
LSGTFLHFSPEKQGDMSEELIIPEETMEVHKHPRHVMHSKKWAEYLLEFVMIFFAVFLGSVAENIRERKLENKKGMEYLESYKNDLLQNQITFQHFDSLFVQLLPVYDSISSIYHDKQENSELQRLSRLLSRGKRTVVVPLSTTNYAQMVNSGSMRLIDNKEITNAMSKYNDEINTYKEFDLQLKEMRSNVYPEVLKIEDLHNFYSFNKDGNPAPDYIPDMDKFPELSREQRTILVNYYRLYISQTRTELKNLRSLKRTNDALLELIEQRH